MSPNPTAVGEVLRSASRPFRKATGVCPTHGPFEAMTIGEYKPGCPTCAEVSRRAREEEEARQRAEAARQQAEEMRKRSILATGVALRFLDKSFEQFQAATPKQKQALHAVRQYCREFADNLKFGRCMVMVGNPGTGKSMLGCILVQELLKQGRSAFIGRAYDCVGRVKSTWQKGAVEIEKQVVQEFVKPDLLVIDEVGVQFGSETEKLILFNIINARYENLKPVVIISNENKNGLENYLGDRAFDRLCENFGQMIIFDWASYRRKG